jgi:DNA-binding protein YbaB
VPTDSEDAVDDWAARAERQTALTVELSERLRKAQASAESRGGEVVITVDHSGGLAAISLSEPAMRLSAGALGEMVLATSRRAQANLAEQINDMVGTLYGTESETASFIGKAYAEQFPEMDEEDEDRDRR